MSHNKQTTFKTGVIGLGVGEKHIQGYELDTRCKVKALCDIDTSTLKRVGLRYPNKFLTSNPDDILYDEDINAVSIASYDDAHFEQIIKAISSGKHVFVEKPLCLSFDELKIIKYELAKKPEIILSSNLILRQTQRFKLLKHKIESGELGNIYYFEGDYDYGRLSKLISGWRGNTSNYSVFLGGGIHLVDLFLWLIGGRPIEFSGFSSKFCSQNSVFPGPDFIIGTVKFNNGVIAKFTSNYGSVTSHHHRLAVYGTKGSFIQSHQGAIYSFSRDDGNERYNLNDEYPGTSKGDLIPNFVSAILDGTELIVTKQEVLECMELALKINQASV